MSFMHSLKKVAHQATKVAKSAENIAGTIVHDTEKALGLANQCKDLEKFIGQLTSDMGMSSEEIAELEALAELTV